MAESEGLGSKIGRGLKNGLKRIAKTKKGKLIIIISIGVLAFLLIIGAAWKQQLLEITSGKCNNNEIEYVAKTETKA